MRRKREYHVYILTNNKRTVLYTGVTNDLAARLNQHRAGVGSAFTKKYNAHILVYYESFDDINDAIEREKRIKGGSRLSKIKLIENINPGWLDLSRDL